MAENRERRSASFGNTRAALAAICCAFLFFAAAPASATTVITSDTVLAADLFDNVVIGADDVTLDCAGNSIVGFAPSAGIELSSRSGVTIKNCTMTGFLVGIAAIRNSSLELIDTTVEGNFVFGLQAEDNSSVSVSGAFTARSNGVFGVILQNNASMTMTGATVTLESNTAGLQISINSSLLVSAQPPSPPSTITAQDNSAFGLTVTSNSHLFLFGQADVVSRRNGSNGISLFSKSAAELDNGATITSEDNTLNGILLEDSTLNMFNMAQFPGSELTLRSNGMAGVSVAKASVFDMGGDSTMLNQDNAVGLPLDDGSSGRVSGSTIVDNVDQDVALTFGARAEFEGNTIGSLSCDETVLIRGDEVCPDDDDDDDDDDD